MPSNRSVMDNYANVHAADSQNEDKVVSSQHWRIAKVTVLVATLAALGTLFSIGVYHVVKRTPSEALADQHDEDTQGAYPLRALVFDSRTGRLDTVSAARSNADVDTCVRRASADEQSQRHHILLLHGIKTTGEMWMPMVRRWLCAETQPQHFVFVMPDLLGHGQSPWPSRKLTVGRHVASLVRLLNDVVPPTAPLHVVGVSLGAILALELSAHLVEFEPVRSPLTLTLLAAPYYTNQDDAERAAKNHSFWYRNKTLAHMACGFLVCRQNWLWKGVACKHYAKKYTGIPNYVVDHAIHHSCSGIASCAHDVVIEHRPTRAAAIIRRQGLPTLIIDGEDDVLCATSKYALASALEPFSTSVVLPNAQHCFVATHVGDVVRHVSTFIQASKAVHETPIKPLGTAN